MVKDLLEGNNMFLGQGDQQNYGQPDYAGLGRFYLPEMGVDRASAGYKEAFDIGKGAAGLDPVSLYLQGAGLAAKVGSAGYLQYLRGNMMRDRRRAANAVNRMADQGQSSEQALANTERMYSQEDPNFDYSPRAITPNSRRAWSNKVGGF